MESVLDECLDRIISRGDSVEQCLERYPDHAAELEPLLATALSASEIRSVEPRREFRQAARGRLLSRVVEKREAQARWRVPRLSWGHRWTVVLTLVLAVLVMGAGTVGASSGSLPGDPLYTVKTGAEKVQAFFTFGEQAKAELYARFAERRTNEIVALAENSRAIPESALSVLSSQTNRALSLATQNAGPEEDLAKRLVQLTANQKKRMAALVAKSGVESKAQLQKALLVLEAAHRRAVLLKQSLPQPKNEERGKGPTSGSNLRLDAGETRGVGGWGGEVEVQPSKGWSAVADGGSVVRENTGEVVAVVIGNEHEGVGDVVGEEAGMASYVSPRGAAGKGTGVVGTPGSNAEGAAKAGHEADATAMSGTSCKASP